MKIVIEEVLEDKEGFVAIAKKSPFYPDGKGGQLGDRGKIGDADVKKVIQKTGFIFHIIDKEIAPGEYEVQIDEARRKDIAAQHTAQHILSAAFVEVAGIETVSFHMGEEISTIDLKASPILKEVVDEAENLANKIILENRKVKEHIVKKDEVQKFPLRKPLSEKVKGNVRIIEVEGFDYSACGGFHVKSTGEIGIVKIVDYEKVKGSLTRIYYVAGMRALREFRKRVDILKRLTSKLTASIDDIERRIEKILEDTKKKGSALDKVSEEYAKVLSSELLKNADRLGDIFVIFYDGFESVGKYLFKFLGDEEKLLIFVKVDGGYEVGSSSLDIGKLIKEISQKTSSKGGGGKNRGRLITNLDRKAILQVLKEILSG